MILDYEPDGVLIYDVRRLTSKYNSAQSCALGGQDYVVIQNLLP